MSWEWATVILGVLGTVTVSVIKFVPQRTVVEDREGHRCATKEDAEAILDLLKEQKIYTHDRFHDVLQGLQPITYKLAILVDRSTRRNFNDPDTL